MAVDTNTDAAEARALEPMPACDDRQPFGVADYMESDSDWLRRNPLALRWLIDNHAAIRLATAEAASGAGERGATAYVHHHPKEGSALHRRPLNDADKANGWTETPLYASLPPATDPAMVEADSLLFHAGVQEGTDKAIGLIPYPVARRAVLAALAAAPTIPATEETA